MNIEHSMKIIAAKMKTNVKFYSCCKKQLPLNQRECFVTKNIEDYLWTRTKGVTIVS